MVLSFQVWEQQEALVVLAGAEVAVAPQAICRIWLLPAECRFHSKYILLWCRPFF